MGADKICSSIEKNVSDSPVFATICDDDSDGDFVKPHSSKKRKKVTKEKVTWTEKRRLTCKITEMTKK